MSDLLGVWSLSPVSDAKPDAGPAGPAATVRDRLGPEVLPAMWAQLPGAHGDLEAIEGDGYILCADAGKLHRDGQRAVAAEGFVAPGGPPLAGILTPTAGSARPLDPERMPRGHFVLAHVDTDADADPGRILHLVRSLSGGERLYYTRVGDLLLFASSVRPLLAHPDLARAIAPAAAAESILVGHPLSGHATAIARIDEVLPGHVLRVPGAGGEIPVQRPLWRIAGARGDPAQLARRFRAELEHSVAMAVGDQRPVAVALSGGIDSSAVAAAAVEVVGADHVVALTYEFADPSHSCETRYARTVCQRLGIRHHDVFPVSFDDFLAAIPETIWRNENSVHWPKAFLTPVSRAIRARGFDRYLTGFGIGSHMAYLGEVARVLSPRFISSLAPRILPRLWRRTRFEHSAWPARLARLHPGLEVPHVRLYHLLLAYLQALGQVRDIAPYYPESIRPLVRVAATSLSVPDPGTTLAAMTGAHGDALRQLALAHLISCIDITRSEKSSRELGVYRVSPAHMSNTIPYAYFPVDPPLPLWRPERRQRPGKYLLQLAYRGVLPDEVLFRRKSWADAVASPDWLGAGRRRMLETLSRFPHDLDWLGPGGVEAIHDWEPRSILASSLAFALWQRMFIDLPPSPSPPTWDSLGSALH